ncbi:MAG: acetyl-CoA carboxylase carboxyl transferase subunit alpha, partial [Proteobacteria bacterium]|nr:acetyl-CoA carboxylase carboxyl transferase subunit alpha [Pseudomonadota bacterium]
AERIANCIEAQLEVLDAQTTDQLLDARYKRLLSFGEFND